MRIAQIATLATPVKPKGSGSIETLVWLLTRDLTRLGHEVTVFAAGGSNVCGRLESALPGPYGAPGVPEDWQLCEWINLARAVERSAGFDVIHSHAYLWAMPLQSMARCPIVHTLHVMPSEDHAILRQNWPAACVTAISRYQWQAFPSLPAIPVVEHGVDADQFTFRATSDDYLCYLGRFTGGKGPLRAIKAARNLGQRLILAGPRSDYFDKHVSPHVDGRAIEYAGPVGGATRDGLLGGARALVYPVRDPEPFGLVLIEAMMCGTPVATFNIGAAPEIVEEGVTGCIASYDEEFEACILRVSELDRELVSRTARERFSSERMAREYLRVYREAPPAQRPCGGRA